MPWRMLDGILDTVDMAAMLLEWDSLLVDDLSGAAGLDRNAVDSNSDDMEDSICHRSMSCCSWVLGLKLDRDSGFCVTGQVS